MNSEAASTCQGRQARGVAGEPHSDVDARYNRGYTPLMKTAISLPDDLFAKAEQLAERFGVSRSELYVRALREYVAAHHHEGVTERLNAIYDREPSSLDPGLMELQIRSLPPEDW